MKTGKTHIYSPGKYSYVSNWDGNCYYFDTLEEAEESAKKDGTCMGCTIHSDRQIVKTVFSEIIYS